MSGATETGRTPAPGRCFRPRTACNEMKKGMISHRVRTSVAQTVARCGKSRGEEGYVKEIRRREVRGKEDDRNPSPTSEAHSHGVTRCSTLRKHHPMQRHGEPQPVLQLTRRRGGQSRLPRSASRKESGRRVAARQGRASPSCPRPCRTPGDRARSTRAATRARACRRARLPLDQHQRALGRWGVSQAHLHRRRRCGQSPAMGGWGSVSD